MPKRRNDKNKGPEKKKSYKYPKEEDNIDSSENSNEIVLNEAKLDKNKSYKYPKEEDSIDSSENSNEIVLDEAKLDKNETYKYPKEEESIESSRTLSENESVDSKKDKHKVKITKNSGKKKYKKRNWNEYLKESNIKESELFNANLKTFTITDEKIDNNKDTEIEIKNDNELNINSNKQGINIEDEKDIKISEYDKIYNIMIESNIMNISVESNDLQPDSENEEPQNNINTNINNNENSKENEYINIKPEESNSIIKETSKFDLHNINDNILSEIPENNIKFVTDDTILFNGKEFKKTNRLNNYVRKDKKETIYYKCIYNRREEKFRTQTKQGPFCKATIQCIFNPNSNVKYKYILKKDHSDICMELQENKYLKKKN